MDLVPSHINLFSVDLDLGGAVGREMRLRKSLKPVLDQYDMVVCDCPPNLTIPTQNALAMSTHYVVPVTPDYLSILGVALLTTRIDELCDSIDHKITNAGIVVSRVGRKATHRENSLASLRDRFRKLVLKAELHERVAVAESAALQSRFRDGGRAGISGIHRDVAGIAETPEGDLLRTRLWNCIATRLKTAKNQPSK